MSGPFDAQCFFFSFAEGLKGTPKASSGPERPLLLKGVVDALRAKVQHFGSLA